MHFITGKSIERRSFLKGMGAAVGLPVLDAMTPAGRGRARAVITPAPYSCGTQTLIDAGSVRPSDHR